MQWFPSLKAVLKRTELSTFFLFLSFPFFCFAASGEGCGFFRESETGSLLVGMNPVLSGEERIRFCIQGGHCCELHVSFRIRPSSASGILLGREYREIRVCRRAFLDPVSGDYVIQMNGRDSGSYRDWSCFYENFSSLLVFSVDMPFEKGMLVRAKERLIYKKLFPPFNILYLIPGKYVFQTSWFELKSGGPS